MQVTIQDLMAVMKQLEDVSRCSAKIVENDDLPASQRAYYSGIMFGVEDTRERLLSLIVKTMQSQDADQQEQC